MSAAELSAQPDLPASAPPPGEQLAAARESRGLSVAEIAQQLKLSPSQVEALESGDYGRLPSAVFVRGFIRNYARLVKVDAAALLATAEPAASTPEQLPGAARPPSAEIPYPTARRVNWRNYAIAVLILAAALAAYEFYPDDTFLNPVKSSQVESPPQVVAKTAQPPVAVTGAAGIIPVAVVELPPVPAQLKEPARAPAAAAEARPSAGEQIVRLRFARESWVEIRDRNGRKIFSQLNSPGTEQTVSGLPPLSLIVGNANGVQLTHNEQPIDLGPHIKIDVARLTLE